MEDKMKVLQKLFVIYFVFIIIIFVWQIQGNTMENRVPIEKYGKRLRSLLKKQMIKIDYTRSQKIIIDNRWETFDISEGWEYVNYDDFERGYIFNGYVQNTENPGWGIIQYWDTEGYRSCSGEHSIWCAGDNDEVWPGDPIPNGIETSLIYGPFSLYDAYDAHFKFKIWSNVVEGQDGLVAYAGIQVGDSIGFEPLHVWTENNTVWNEITVPLKDVEIFNGGGEIANFCGENFVYIKFTFESDTLVQSEREGIYLDDVEILKNTTEPTGKDIAVEDFWLSFEEDEFSVTSHKEWNIKLKNLGPSDVNSVRIGLHCTLDESAHPNINSELFYSSQINAPYVGEESTHSIYPDLPFAGNPVYFYAIVPDADDDTRNNVIGPKAYIVTGIKVYGDIQFYDTFFETYKSVPYTTVKIINNSNGNKLYTTWTDENGNFGKEGNDIWIQDVDDIALKLESNIFVNNETITSVHLNLNEPVHISPLIDELNGKEKGDFSETVLKYDESSEMDIFLHSLQIAVMIYDEYKWIQDETGWKRNYLPVHYNHLDQVNNSKYDMESDFLLVTGKTDHFWSAPLHEYAHAVMNQIYNWDVDQGTPIPTSHKHYTVAANNLKFPWVEGWAQFMECAVYNNLKLSLYQSGPYAGSTIENNDWWWGENYDNYCGEYVEGAVASVLWDIWDSNYDELDETHGSMNESFNHIYEKLNNHPKSLPIFLSNWGKNELLSGIAQGHNICTGWIDITSDLNPYLPLTFEVSTNYPNPFNPKTTIRYQMPEPGAVNIKIYNMLGQYIKTLVESYKPAGWHKTSWDGTDSHGMQVVSGIYLTFAELCDYQKVIKITLLK